MTVPALRCDIDQEHPYAVVRIEGLLDVTGAARVRAAVLKVLAQQPRSVVIDVAGLRVDDAQQLSVFRTLAHRAAMWPVVPVALCRPSVELAHMLGQQRQRLPLFACAEEAAAGLADPAATPSIREDLLPVTGATRRCRELITEACVRWDLPDLLGPASSIMTEMVADSIEYVGTVMNVQILRTRRHLHLSLRDGGSAGRGPLGAGESDEPVGGLPGRPDWVLTLMNELAHRWGCEPTPEGRALWAVLKPRPG